MLLGWIAGGMLVSDPGFIDPDQWLWLPKLGQWDENGLAVLPSPVYWSAHICGALLVLGAGKWLAARKKAAPAAHSSTS